MSRCAVLSLSVVVVLMLLAYPDKSSAQDDVCDEFEGACWNSLSDYEKIIALKAFRHGKSAGYTQGRLINEEIISFLERDRFGFPERTTFGDIIGYVDKLYSFPVNRDIPLHRAMLLSALYLRDDDSDDRLQLLRLFRDDTTLPFEGTLEKIISPSRVSITDRAGRRFDIVFPRSKYTNSDETKTATALNYMTVLSSLTFDDDACTGHKASIRIQYPMDFFTEDGSLRAEVILTGNKVCVSGQTMSLESLGLNVREIKLGQRILSEGYAEYDSSEDPKWSQDVTFGALFYDVYDDANDRELSEFAKNIEAAFSY